MATLHCTSLDQAIREGAFNRSWLAIPLALGWIVYVLIAIPVALVTSAFGRSVKHAPERGAREARAATASRRVHRIGGVSI